VHGGRAFFVDGSDRHSVPKARNVARDAFRAASGLSCAIHVATSTRCKAESFARKQESSEFSPACYARKEKFFACKAHRLARKQKSLVIGEKSAAVGHETCQVQAFVPCAQAEEPCAKAGEHKRRSLSLED